MKRSYFCTARGNDRTPSRQLIALGKMTLPFTYRDPAKNHREVTLSGVTDALTRKRHPSTVLNRL